MRNKIKLKKGDEVVVLAGKDKGKRGKIVRVIPDIRKVVVSDINGRTYGKRSFSIPKIAAYSGLLSTIVIVIVLAWGAGGLL